MARRRNGRAGGEHRARSALALGERARTALGRILLVGLLCAAAATCAVNGLVRWVSGPGTFLLDPRWLGPKTRALGAYARHRGACLIWRDADVIAEAHKAAARHHVDPDLFGALVEAESGSIAHRISPTGACGPAQLTLRTARELGVSDPFDPRESLDGGARYLRLQLDRFGGRKDLALAAYNAGPGAVHGAVPHNGETENYVPRVLALYAGRRRR